MDTHRPTGPSAGLNSEAHLADGGNHVFVFLSAQKFLDAEVELLQQLFISRQTDRRTQPGQQLAQLVPDRKVRRWTGERVERTSILQQQVSDRTT